MDIAQTVQWSREENVSSSRAIVLSNVPLDTSDDTIEKVLNTVKVLGSTKICGRRGDVTGKQLFVLVETSTDLDPSTLPPEMEVKAIVMGDQSPKSDISVDLVNAIGKLVDKCNQASSDGPSYRKLRLFSGLKHVPPGEEEYKVWMEQAAQMIGDWQCTESSIFFTACVPSELQNLKKEIKELSTQKTPSENSESVNRDNSQRAKPTQLSGETGQELSEGRHGAPDTTRSTCGSSMLDAGKPRLPEGLTGPVSEVPVQIEGIFTKALLDRGSQPVKNIEIWGLSSHKHPFDGYLPLRLEFTEGVAGVRQVIELLAIVCPDPVKREGIAILLGTNTSLVKKLLESCRKQAVSLVPQLTSKQLPEQNTLSSASFDFGDSRMPEEAKQSLCEKMMQRKEVFSLREKMWDVQEAPLMR
ncbi:hypothetical protein H4Q32_003762 [Labeo rohita]|uniref:Paraneoplastic antigen Ma1-like protein n=1 Tax=Labeo rohita TaxID=84645 RepID=A0ABQ8MWT1_LABRO|nr:hypothetical protein H4Q32_003762 [Labeo rohita]